MEEKKIRLAPSSGQYLLNYFASTERKSRTCKKKRKILISLNILNFDLQDYRGRFKGNLKNICILNHVVLRRTVRNKENILLEVLEFLFY